MILYELLVPSLCFFAFAARQLDVHWAKAFVQHEFTIIFREDTAILGWRLALVLQHVTK